MFHSIRGRGRRGSRQRLAAAAAGTALAALFLLGGSARAEHADRRVSHMEDDLDTRNAEDEADDTDDLDIVDLDEPSEPQADDPTDDDAEEEDPTDEGTEPDGDGGITTSVIPSGVTLRGTYAVKGYAPSGKQRSATSAVSFGFELGGLEAQWITEPGEGTRECFGSFENPRAAPGFFCLYQRRAQGIAELGIYAPSGRRSAAGSFGAVIQVKSGASFDGRFYSIGSWAATPR
jgi:hypothetical protein